MTVPLSPLNHTDGVCIKCGEPNAACRYLAEGATGLDCPPTLAVGEKLPERMRRTCKTCGYAWDEACLDSKNRR